MALEVGIGANNDELKSKLAESQLLLENLRKQKAVDVKMGLDVKNLQTQINDAKANISALTKQLNTNSSAMDTHSRSAANGGNTLMQFSRIAQDAPFGIMGIGNNLTATAESFGHLARTSGGAGNALKAVASSIMGTGGILLAVSLVTSGLTYMSQKGITVADVFDKLSGNFDEYAEAFKKANLAAYNDDGVVKAVSDVNQLREEVKLAKDGFIDKQKVIDHYNETMGKTAGLVTTLDGVEQQLVKNGDAFIQMQLYKATATLAQAEAAKEMLNQEKISKQSAKDHTGVLEYMKGAMVGVASGQGLMSTGMFATIEGIKSQGKAFDESGKKMNANLSISKKYNKMAADLGKKMGFNFFGDTEAKKAPKAKNDTYLIEKELQDKLKAMNNIAFSDKIALIDSYTKLELSKRQKLKDDILKQEEEYNKSVLDGQNKLATLSAFAKSEEYNNQKQQRQQALDEATAQIQAHEDFLANVGKTEESKKAAQEQAAYSARLAQLKTFLAQKLITQQEFDALVFEAAKNTNAVLKQFDADVYSLVTGSIADTFGQLGTVIGDALATGGNVLNAIGSTLLQGLGKFISEMGGLLIQYGTMAVIKGKLDTAIAVGGPVAIAAGLGAIAVGVALKAIGGAIAAKAKGGAGGGAVAGGGTGQRGGVSSGADVSSPTSSVSSGGSFSNSGGTVVFEIAGQKLIGVLNNTTQANLRLGGSGLAG